MIDVLVFGSNLAGKHGKGAAKTAREFYGAIQFRGEGLQGLGLYGSSFAIPTKDEYLRTLSLDRIREGVERFLTFARKSPQFNFIVTRVGCGLAGYSDDEIAPMFRGAPENCGFDPTWEKYGFQVWEKAPQGWNR